MSSHAKAPRRKAENASCGFFPRMTLMGADKPDFLSMECTFKFQASQQTIHACNITRYKRHREQTVFVT
jgi:hypothetical protein